ncbi:hypothetical protein AVEN_226729-1 [Araneus ventricosus]|uniref:Uncharacterized protein n=1 Tax=Araneus ventricosus TaxID=182803 RepID=A0A4Y2S215_ARAVE|nr:hypothetical protein AVEN_226729-1 [Araneus ventricosus]
MPGPPGIPSYLMRWLSTACQSIRGPLNHSRRNINIESEGGVLMAITYLSPTSPAGGTSDRWSGGNSTPNHYYIQQGSEILLNYPVASHLRTLGAPSHIIDRMYTA